MKISIAERINGLYQLPLAPIFAASPYVSKGGNVNAEGRTFPSITGSVRKKN